MTTRRFLRFVGLALSLAAVLWIIARFARSDAADLIREAPIGHAALMGALGLGAMAYAAAMLLPGLAWWRLIVAFAATPPPARSTVATYAVSQYGKYLPGNVAHYALRHGLSRRYDVPHAALGLASVLEAALLLLSALGLILLADSRRLALLSWLDPRAAIAALALLLAALGIALHLARKRASLARFGLPALPPTIVLVTSVALYVTFLVACAAIIDGIAHVLGIAAGSFGLVLGATAASWLAGFVVIGAPGGLGVREAAFVALAGSTLGADRALVVISLFRVVTFLGDTLFFAAGALAMRRAARSARAH
jgi:uncharacterized membrane protein YbhN (UPF0104 family)